MITDEELKDGLNRANCVLNLMKEHSLFDEDDCICGFRRWATADRVVLLIQEIKTWRMVHGLDLSDTGL